MGQTSSQLAQQSQHVEIARTPTPELSDIESKPPREDADESNAMAAQTQARHDQTPTIHWKSINGAEAQKRSTPPLSLRNDPSGSSVARTKITTRKPKSQTKQRRLPSPRDTIKESRSRDNQKELRSLQVRRRTLPKAAQSEDDLRPGNLSPAKPVVPSSPLRTGDTRRRAHRSPMPYLSPVPALSPPQVIIPSSEIVEATQAQALENHVEALQERLYQSQLHSRSPLKVTESRDSIDSTEKSGENVLVGLQRSAQGGEWFSKIDEAVAEVEATQVADPVTDVTREKMRVQTLSEEPAELPNTTPEECGSFQRHVESELDPCERDHVRTMESDEAAETSEQHMPEHDAEDKVCDEEDNEEGWPTPTDAEIERYMEQRPLCLDDLEKEQALENPQSKWERRQQEVIAARNSLRDYIVECNLERHIYRGLAKYVTDERGVTSLVHAADGEKFPTAKHTKAERAEAKARKAGMKSTKQALLAAIAKSELEAQMFVQRVARAGEANAGTARGSAVAVEPTAASPRLAARETEPWRGKSAACSDPVTRKPREAARTATRPRASARRAVIPTPPISDQDTHAVSNATQPTLVHQWLASQGEEPPMPPDELDRPDKSSRKRKRNSDDVDFALPPSEVAPEDSGSTVAPDATAAHHAKRAAKRPRHRDEHDAIQSSQAKRRQSDNSELKKSPKARRAVTMSGLFTQHEKEVADQVFDNSLAKDGLSEAELIAQIQNWKTCGSFKIDMFAAFPDRSADSVRKFCQRRYHAHPRGPWTEEQDDALRSAHARRPGKWTEISDLVGRTAADCKDRWRNHLENDNAALGPWSVEEEEQLLAAVEECLDVIREEKRDDTAFLRDRERMEAMINWRVVLEKIDGRRSAKRCREKYFKLQALRPNAGNNNISSNARRRSSQTNQEPQKVVQAKHLVNTFEIGDFYDVFVEIYSSFEDLHQHFRHEKNVVWSIVSAKNPYSRFSGDTYSALRRVALEKAVNEWPINNAKIKKRLESVDTAPAQARVLARWIEKDKAGPLNRAFRTDLIGKSNDEINSIRRSRKAKEVRRPRKNVGKSKEYVTEFEDDDELDDRTAALKSHQNVNTRTFRPPDEESDVRETVEKYDASEDDGRSEVTQQVPDTQFEVIDVAMTDVESLRGNPSLAPSEFLDRLKSSGGSGKRKSIGYGRKDRMKEERRRARDR